MSVAVETTTSTDIVLEPKEIKRLDYKAPEYFIQNVDLTVKIFTGETFVHSKLTCYRNPTTPHGANLDLDGEELTFVACRVDGEAVTTESGKLSLPKNGHAILNGSLFPEDPEKRFVIEFEVKIVPETNTKLTGLFKSSLIYCTQCEAEGFRRITYFLDRPDVMSSYSCRVEAPKDTCPVLLSNGDEVAKGDNVDGDATRHWAEFVDPWKKPSYLFALVAGKLSHITGTFRTMSGKDVQLNVFSEPSDADKLQWALHSLQLSMKWDEEEYGREYDLGVFNIVAVGDFNMGAMENKGLNVFNTALLLASPMTATDRDYMRVLGVVGHEYFHNWTGNRVTCRSWFELTLKEGLTVFRDQNFSFDQGGAASKRIEDVSLVRSAQFAEDAGPMAHAIRPDAYVSIENFYTVTVYDKGSEVIKMYHTILGKEGFRRGTDLYFQRHDGQAVTCDDFLNAMADANPDAPVDFKGRFSRWYSTPGTPIVEVVEARFDAEHKVYRLTLKQSPSAQAVKAGKTEPLVIPVKYGLLSRATGKEVASGVLNMTESMHAFEVPVEGEHGDLVPSLLRDFSAPVRMVFPQQTLADRIFLMANDSDAVTAWDAGQQVASDVIYHVYKAQLNRDADHKAVGPLKALPSAEEVKSTLLSPEVVAAYRHIVVDESIDNTLAALNLTLIDTKSLIGSFAANAERNQGGVDPQAVFRARRAVQGAIASALFEDIKARYAKLTAANVEAEAKNGYEVTPEAMGLRALRNTLLHLLSAAGHADGVDAAVGAEVRQLAVEQHKTATNLTDKLTAVGAVVGAYGTAERDQLLQAAFDEAKGDAQVEDKWFSLQASADHAHVIDEVRKLKDHPKFNAKNPNRLRALVGAFAGNNGAFHDPSGAGYEFLADFVIYLNDVNSAIAARLAGALGAFKAYDAPRQEKMRAALEKIRAKEGLSAEVFEIVSKALAQ